jgi:hypothetical protein
MIGRSLLRPRANVFYLLVGILSFLGLFHALPVASPDPYTKEKRSAVVCGAASWEDVVAFFLLNYVAHAATIHHFPGDSSSTQIWWTACVLFVPFAGVWRACQSIANARPFEKNPLERAKYAGALCTMISEPLRTDRTELRHCRLRGKLGTPDEDGFVSCVVRIAFDSLSRTVTTDSEKIHGGTARDGSLSIVPPSVKVVPNCDTPKVQLSCSNGLLKSATAVVQVVFACLTLYRTKGDQVEMYGYAAFGLTVIPYATMSILNLTANLLTPEYPTLFMVQSDGMDKMQRGHSKPQYDGTVGTIVPENAATGFYDMVSVRMTMTRPSGYFRAKVRIPEGYVGDNSDGEFEAAVSYFGRHETILTFDRSQRIRNLVAIAIGITALVTPYVLIAIFSHGFETGTLSTPLQRGFLMSWLVVGQVFGALSGWLGHNDSTAGNPFLDMPAWRERDFTFFWSVVLPVLSVAIAPALGGFVVVGLMIKQFGSCVVV